MKAAAAVPLKTAAWAGNFVEKAHPNRAPAIKLRTILRRTYIGVSIGKG